MFSTRSVSFPVRQAVRLSRQLAAVVGESAQQYRTALREMHDGGDPFAAPFGGVRGDEERQPRLYGSRDFCGDQRRQGGPVPGAPLQIAVKDDAPARHPRLVGYLAFEENRIPRRVFPAVPDDRVAENILGGGRRAVKPLPAFVDFLPDASRENDGSQLHAVFAVGDDRRDGQLSVGREVHAGGDRQLYAEPVAVSVSGGIAFAAVSRCGSDQTCGQQAGYAV